MLKPKYKCMIPCLGFLIPLRIINNQLSFCAIKMRLKARHLGSLLSKPGKETKLQFENVASLWNEEGKKRHLTSDAENIETFQVGALLDLIYTGVCNDPGDIEPSGELALLSLYKWISFQDLNILVNWSFLRELEIEREYGGLPPIHLLDQVLDDIRRTVLTSKMENGFALVQFAFIQLKLSVQ